MSSLTSKKQMLDSEVISKIPDAILIDILSHLSMKEAVRTSVLSHSWKNLWKFYSGCLDFDDMETKVLLFRGKKEFHTEKRKYIDWVNQVVVSHQAPAIEQFRVSFDFDKDQTITLDKWIEFAASRKVHRLELDLSSLLANKKIWKHSKGLEEIYNFPTQLLKEFKVLTSLRLEVVNITEEGVLNLLSHCPSLEELSISNAPSLCNLRIVAGASRLWSSLKLKHLEIGMCMLLEHLEVSAAKNLAFFKYSGKPKYWGEPMRVTKMHFQDVPNLSSVSVGRGDFCEHLVATRFDRLPFPISQIQMLTLDLGYMPADKQFMFPSLSYDEFELLPNVRQLELVFSVIEGYRSMLFVGSFLRASPCLHKLVLKYKIDRNANISRDAVYGRQVEGCKYECLKEVEFLGWNGGTGEDWLFTHLIQEAAGSLERITIDPRYPIIEGIWNRRPVRPEVIAAQEDARKRAREDLGPKVSPPTKLVIL